MFDDYSSIRYFRYKIRLCSFVITIIHGCYSLGKIALAPICACTNNRWIWRHNTSTLRSPDVTDQLWWRHNTKSKETVLSDNGKIIDRSLFLAELYVQDIRERARNKIIHSLSWMRFAIDFHPWLRHSWKSLANRLTRDTNIVIRGNSCIILYTDNLCRRCDS